jgi:mevalonate kinase
MNEIIARAPGRVCLLGDNADLIEKPALAAAISAFLTFRLKKRGDAHVILYGRDIGVEESFRLGDPLTLDTPLKYVKAVYLRLAPFVKSGFEATIHSQIPVSAGLSSSTALCIAAIQALNMAFQIHLGVGEIAELSYELERIDLDIECGRMDQYAIAYGGVTYIQTGSTPGVERLNVSSLPIVVADTEEKHDTRQLQKWLRDRIASHDRVLIESLERVVNLVERGKQALLRGEFEALGDLMSQQQIEENLMGTSTERLQAFCRVAIEAGAWGAKQMGAGGGGCMIALCPPGGEIKVKQALEGLGAPAWAFEVCNEALQEDSTGLKDL